MFLRLSQKRKSSPKELMKLEEMKMIYSSREDKIQLLKKFAANRIKTCEKTIPKKKIKISIQVPRLENSFSDEDCSKTESPCRSNALSVGRKRRVIVRSNLERVYGFTRRTMTPYHKYSYGVFE